MGVDVGGKRKGFDAAVLDERNLVRLGSRLKCGEVVQIVDEAQPSVVAIDSPCSCAAPGETTRDGERELARAVCGIRWTPADAVVRANPYYAWIVEGLALYRALEGREFVVIEVFPTASWTRWLGFRGSRARAAWTRDGLTRLGLHGVRKIRIRISAMRSPPP